MKTARQPPVAGARGSGGSERIYAILLGDAPSSPTELAMALVQMGRTRALHNAGEAREAYSQALALYRHLGDRKAEADSRVTSGAGAVLPPASSTYC
jgi:hypothetical protein